MAQEIELPNGVILYDVPDDANDEQIKQEAIRMKVAVESDFPKAATNVGEDVLNTAGELAAGFNRGVGNVGDFFITDPINAASELMGSDTRIPSVSDAMGSMGMNEGNFMEPGIPRDLTRRAGEAGADALVAGGVIRRAAAAIPEVTGVAAL